MTLIVSATWSLTVGGVCGARLEPSCLDAAGINDGVGTEIGRDAVDASVVANTLVGA